MGFTRCFSLFSELLNGGTNGLGDQAALGWGAVREMQVLSSASGLWVPVAPASPWGQPQNVPGHGRMSPHHPQVRTGPPRSSGAGVSPGSGHGCQHLPGTRGLRWGGSSAGMRTAARLVVEQACPEALVKSHRFCSGRCSARGLAVACFRNDACSPGQGPCLGSVPGNSLRLLTWSASYSPRTVGAKRST